MQDISFKVRERRFTTGAGDHATIFDADVQLLPGTMGVDVVLLNLDRSDGESIAGPAASAAIDCIREGMEEVLTPRGLSASVIISNLFLHPTDFRPRRHKLYAAQYLEAAIKQEAQEPYE